MKRLYFLLCMILVIGLFAGVSPVLAAETHYTVQPGDTLYSISRRYNVSVSALAAANGLTMNSWLYTGQQLVIPGVAATPAESPAAPAQAPAAATDNVYTVKEGETLLTIAARHGLRVSQLAEANGLVERWVDPADGRRTLLGLTSEGEAKLAGLSLQHRDELRRFRREMNDVLRELD